MMQKQLRRKGADDRQITGCKPQRATGRFTSHPETSTPQMIANHQVLRRMGIQARLKIGETNDPCEQEAERVAAQTSKTRPAQHYIETSRLLQRQSAGPASFEDCRKKVFGSRKTMSSIDRPLPSKQAVDLIVSIVGSEADHAPVALAVIWAIETGFNFAPKNHLNKNGTIDYGPGQINSCHFAEVKGEERKNSVFGTNLKAGEKFNGNARENLKFAWNLYLKRGHGGYNPGSSSRSSVAEKVRAELAPLFDCLLSGKNKKAEGTLQKKIGNHVNRNSQEHAVPSIVHDVLQSPGEPMDSTTACCMEGRFGVDFSHVRIHTDSKAAQSAQVINAMAYTVGRDVVFGEGQYSPSTHAGKQLLAHELTHCLQQAHGNVSVQRFTDFNYGALPGDWEPGSPTQGPRKRAEKRTPGISAELEDAPYESVAAASKSYPENEMRVLAWLQAHRHEIVDAEQKFRIDRRAIAGAIAGEALLNVAGPLSFLISRASKAVGKPHVRETLLSPFEGAPVTKQVEEAGYLSPKSRSERVKYIESSSAHAIEYISAIMAAFADIAAEFGYDIRSNPNVLTNCYQGSDLKKWRAHLARKKPNSSLRGENSIAKWVDNNMVLLEDAVGKPVLPESAPISVVSSLEQKKDSSGGTKTITNDSFRKTIVETALSLSDQHYLMGAAGGIPDRDTGISGGRKVVLNAEDHSAAVDVDYGKMRGGKKTHVCGGRYSKVEKLPKADPSNEEHQKSPQNFRWERLSDDAKVWGEACEGKRHFDCGGFVSYCYCQACKEIRYPGPASNLLTNSFGWQKIDQKEVQGGDIAYRPGHAGLCINNKEVVSALGKKWGVARESVDKYSQFGYLKCLVKSADKGSSE
jgi:hypothetical protein